MRPITDADRIYVLALAHALIQAGWCQYHCAVDARGEDVDTQSPAADRWCLLGALNLAAEQRKADLGMAQGLDFCSLWSSTDALLETLIPTHTEIYNDEPHRRKRDVLRLIERAAARIGK